MDIIRRQPEFRPLDFIYDPVYLTSDKSDYTATASQGLGCVSQYAIRPQYDTMFSDNEKYARNVVVLRSTILPNHINISWTAKKHRMLTDRKPRVHDPKFGACGYFTRPNVKDLNPFANIVHIISPTEKRQNDNQEDKHAEDETNVKPSAAHKRSKTPKKVRRAVQTDFRESEAQTYPWVPPGPQGLDKMPPEIVTDLDFEHWEAGYPVTQTELNMIERTRLRRACERALNSMNVTLSNKKYLIKQMEIHEWAQREDEIQRIYNLREKLARKQTHMFTYLNRMRMERRIEEVTKRKRRETEKKVAQITRKRDRELRKLAAKRDALPISDVVDIYNNYTSELYIQSTTKGANPKFKSRVKMGMTPLEMRKTLRHLDPGETPLESQDIEAIAKSKPHSLCPQDRKWSTHTLVDLYASMKQWRTRVSDYQKHEEDPVEMVSVSSQKSEVQLDSAEDERYLNAVLIQKLIRGRHWQRQVREGMAKDAALVEEVKQNQVLTEEDVCALEDKKQAMFAKLTKEESEIRRRKMLEDAQGQMQGETISAVLDFLSKELARLEDERRAHALSLLAETQREVREARESGRRQRDTERRREFDEMFKQMVKIKQDTVDGYLESLLMDSVQCLARDKARDMIVEKARLVDLRAQEAMLGADRMEEEAMVKDLLYNIAIPELANIRANSCEEDSRQGGQTGINNLLLAMDQEAESSQDRDRAVEDQGQSELLRLQDQLLDILFPMRNAQWQECPEMPSEATSKLMIGAMEDEIGELSEDIQDIADDIGKDLFEQLLKITHRAYETVTNQIIEEIIRTLLARPNDVDPSSPADQSDFNLDLFRDLNFFRDSTSFTNDPGDNVHASEDENGSNKIVESEVGGSEISQEFNEEDYQEHH